MNTKLKEAVAKLSQLPEEEQETFAAIIEAELEDEAKWQRSFGRSAPLLERLAKEAQEDYKTGRTEPLDPDTL